MPALHPERLAGGVGVASQSSSRIGLL